MPIICKLAAIHPRKTNHGKRAPATILIHDERFLQEVPDGVGGLGTLAQPRLDSGSVEVGLLLHRVVPAEVFEGGTVATLAGVDRDDAVERGPLATEAGETDLRRERGVAEVSESSMGRARRPSLPGLKKSRTRGPQVLGFFLVPRVRKRARAEQATGMRTFTMFST